MSLDGFSWFVSLPARQWNLLIIDIHLGQFGVFVLIVLMLFLVFVLCFVELYFSGRLLILDKKWHSPFASALALFRDLFATFVRNRFVIVFCSPFTSFWHSFGCIPVALATLLTQCWSLWTPPSFRHPNPRSTCSQPLDTLVERILHS